MIKAAEELAEEYKMGISTVHGSREFYEFLRPSHREKKHLFAMVALVCVRVPRSL